MELLARIEEELINLDNRNLINWLTEEDGEEILQDDSALYEQIIELKSEKSKLVSFMIGAAPFFYLVHFYDEDCCYPEAIQCLWDSDRRLLDLVR